MERTMQQEISRIFEERSRAEKQEKAERYRRLNRFVRPHQILFAGSSLMEQFPIYELLLDQQLPYTIYNRGIGGITTFELLENMDVCIYDLQPDYLYINIGTNDIRTFEDGTAWDDNLQKQYDFILGKCKEKLPEAKVYVMAYYPMNETDEEFMEMGKLFGSIRSNEKIRTASSIASALAEKHGFSTFANVDIMDATGEFKIPVKIGKHLKYDIVGENLKNYDSILNLAHGKGHAMGGFGANLKNQSIGIASRNGKAYIHSCGQDENPDTAWGRPYEQIEFIESMAEAANAVADYIKDNNKQIAYITVMNALSVDCDCDAHQGDPVMADLGIVASLDPVANDQAFIDMVWNSPDPGAHLLQERVDRQLGREILPYAESIGLGTRDYELVELD